MIPHPSSERDRRRREALEHFKTEPADEVLAAYLNRNLPAVFLPVNRNMLGSEPFVLNWLPLVRAAESKGAIQVLEEAIFELTFPVAQGVSRSVAYQALSLPAWGGEPPQRKDHEKKGPDWETPENWKLSLSDTAGGLLPVIEPGARGDFITLVQAVIHRNEPVPLPDSIGSFMVAGYANRKVYREVRELMKRGLLAPEACDPRLWSEKFLLISPGPYSGTTGQDMGFADDVWSQVSRKIRIEHEGCHYLTRRVFPNLVFGLQDELIGDLAGLMGALGKFRAEWFLRFMGIDEKGVTRPEGRAAFYQLPIFAHPAACETVGRMLVAAAHNLESLLSDWDLSRWMKQRHFVLTALTWLSLEELAAPGFADLYAGMQASFESE